MMQGAPQRSFSLCRLKVLSGLIIKDLSAVLDSAEILDSMLDASN
jgi:hypothetical protein